jgi:hypothetical protein
MDIPVQVVRVAITLPKKKLRGSPKVCIHISQNSSGIVRMLFTQFTKQWDDLILDSAQYRVIICATPRMSSSRDDTNVIGKTL